MDKILYVLLLAVSGNCFPAENESVQDIKRIYGGSPTNISEVPYFAQVLQYGRVVCGATIIHEEWLVSAAHCFDEDDNDLSIVTGSSYQGNRANKAYTHEIDEIIIHSRWDEKAIYNDIALIKLVEPIKIDEKQKPIEIVGRATRTGEKLKVSGFGKIGKNKGMSPVLKSAEVSVIDLKVCRRSYTDLPVNAKVLCALSLEADACEGDSGGPAVVDGKLAGIVSYGPECQTRPNPGVYTQVYSYRKWIENNSGLIF